MRSALPSGETAAEFYCEPAAVGTVLTAEDSAALLALLNAVPNGVQAMSADIAGLVQTSLNLGILKTEAERAILTFSVRSSVNAEKTALIERLVETGRQYGASYSGERRLSCLGISQAVAPARRDGRLLRAALRQKAGRRGHPRRSGVRHLLRPTQGSGRRLFDPQMHDIHTTRERLDIASTSRTWDFLLAVLAAL